MLLLEDAISLGLLAVGYKISKDFGGGAGGRQGLGRRGTLVWYNANLPSEITIPAITWRLVTQGLRSDAAFAAVQRWLRATCHVSVLMGTFGMQSEASRGPHTRHCPDGYIWCMAQGHPWTRANHRKTAPKRSNPFQRSFCKERTRIASPPIKKGGEAFWACCWPCNWAAIVWTAMTGCAALWGQGVWMPESSAPRESILDHSGTTASTVVWSLSKLYEKYEKLFGIRPVVQLIQHLHSHSC